MISQHFVAMLESLRMGPTFARGRRDARAGHVRSITISSSLVTAQVRGPEDPTAFRARIATRAFGAADWARVEDALATQARYVADLLAGRLPPNIVEIFAEAGLSLLPLSLDEVAMDCACERWPMPCVHLAATCYALAESFDTDPFGIFAWRGRGREELLTHLTQLRGTATPDPLPPPDATLSTSDAFWSFGTLPASPHPGVPAQEPYAGPYAEVGPPPRAARPDLLLDQLDPPPLRYEGRALPDLLRPAYLALPPNP
jgi:uncharacterized Zn finger protein